MTTTCGCRNLHKLWVLKLLVLMYSMSRKFVDGLVLEQYFGYIPTIVTTILCSILYSLL